MNIKKSSVFIALFIFLFSITSCSSQTKSASDKVISSTTLSETTSIDAPAATTAASLPCAIEPLKQDGIRTSNTSGARTENGFFSIEYEVTGVNSYNDFEYGYRLFYNDFTTMKSYPLILPNGVTDGYIPDKTSAFSFYISPNIFTTNDKIIICYESELITMDYSLENYQHYDLPNIKNSINSFVDNNFLYSFTASSENSNEFELNKSSLTTYESSTVISNLADTTLYLPNSPTPSLYNACILEKKVSPLEDSPVEYSSLNLMDGSLSPLLTIEGGVGNEYTISEDAIVWVKHFYDENTATMHRFDLVTKEETTIPISNEFFIPQNTSIWDGHWLITSSLFSDNYCNFDFATNTMSEEYSWEKTDKNPLISYPYIWGEYEDYYIIRTDFIEQTVFISENKKLVDTGKTTSEFEHEYGNDIPNTHNTKNQYSLIKKEDYWNNILDYTSLTYVENDNQK